jgi:biopolymer transport protein ExbD
MIMRRVRMGFEMIPFLLVVLVILMILKALGVF